MRASEKLSALQNRLVLRSFFEVNCVLADVITESGEIIDHGYMHTSPVLWQCHQSHIVATISIHTPDVVN